MSQSFAFTAAKKYDDIVNESYGGVYFRSPTAEDLKNLVWMVCLDVLIAHTPTGRIVRRHGKGVVLVGRSTQQLSWNLYATAICGSGMAPMALPGA